MSTKKALGMFDHVFKMGHNLGVKSIHIEEEIMLFLTQLNH